MGNSAADTIKTDPRAIAADHVGQSFNVILDALPVLSRMRLKRNPQSLLWTPGVRNRRDLEILAV